MSDDDETVLERVRAAVAQGDFEPAYQPIVSLPARRIVGFEALARWRRPEGLLSPGAFQDALEHPAAEAAISEAIAMAAVSGVAEMRRAGRETGRLSVNLAERHLDDVAFAERWLSAAASEGLSGADLIAEVRETSRLSRLAAAAPDGLRRLTSDGVWVALDDFGTGFAPLTSLLMPGLSRIKLDVSFSRRAAVDPKMRAVIRRCVQLTEDLGLDLVAEGVEDEATETVLVDLGCRAAQGYLYGRPAALADILAN